MLQCTLSEQDQPRERFLFDGAHPALRVGIEIGRAWREWHARDACLINNALKGWTVLTVFVMDEILPRGQKAPVRHRHVPSDLRHPGLIGVRRHPGNMHFPGAEPDKEQDVIRYSPVVFCHFWFQCGTLRPYLTPSRERGNA